MRAPGRRTGQGGTGTLPRAALAVGLLLLAALGSAAREEARFSAAGMLRAGQAPVTVAAGAGLIAAACLAVAMLVILVTRRRAGGLGQAGGPVTRWYWSVAALATVAAVALLVGVSVHGGHRLRRRIPLPAATAQAPLPATRPVPGDQLPSAIALALVVTAAVGFAAAVLWLRRRRPAAAEAAAEEPGSPLAAAVAAGSAALERVTDARQAIIACYAAMEAALAAAGAPRRPADTPEELLGRAHRGGVLRAPAAGRLAGLFREARFSTHLLGDAERDAAALALRDISRELEHPR